jgi:hypothetical protein
MSYAYLISPAEPDTATDISVSELANKIRQNWPEAEVTRYFEANSSCVLRWRVSPLPHSLMGGLFNSLKTISIESGDFSAVAHFAIWYRRNILPKDQITLFYISSMDQDALFLTSEITEETIIRIFS